MPDATPLKPDEIAFIHRLVFEVLNFAEPIEKTAQPKFRTLGFDNGAIENFCRVMSFHDHPVLDRVFLHEYEPPAVEACPWENQATFLRRVAELQDWLREHGREPCGIRPFIFEINCKELLEIVALREAAHLEGS